MDCVWPKANFHRSLGQRPRNTKRKRNVWPKAIITITLMFHIRKADAEKYVRDQEKHHRKKTFQEEFREFLERYGIEYDERYVWD